MKVTISFDRYKELVKAERTLDGLLAGGVNGGWDWYDESLEQHRDNSEIKAPTDEDNPPSGEPPV